jgi:hypothetical protein
MDTFVLFPRDLRKLFIHTIFLLSFCSLGFSQEKIDIQASISWTSDSSFLLKTLSKNFGKPILVNLKIVNKSNSFQQINSLWEQDSILLDKGIAFFRKEIPFLLNDSILYTDSSHLQFSFYAVEGTLLREQLLHLPPRKRNWASIEVADSLVHIKAIDQPLQLSIWEEDSLSHSFSFIKDTNLLWYELITSDPLRNRGLLFQQGNASGAYKTDSIWYINGKLYSSPPAPKSAEEAREKDKRTWISLEGNTSVENQAFSAPTQHANGLQYPNTTFRSNNTLYLMGLPFQVNANHSTNKNIDPNFRNFFSIRFDAQHFRSALQDQLLKKELEQQYSLDELNKDLASNEASLERLKSLQQMQQYYPRENLEMDSLLQLEEEQLQSSLFKDSLKGLSNVLPDSTLSIDTSSIASDSSQQKIQRLIKQLERSKALKEQHREKLLQLENSSLPTIDRIDERSLFENTSGPLSLLSRVERFELGNFYQYTGEYAIRDIEMKGVNGSFLLNRDNEFHFLYGKVNDFQSFNLDRIEENKQVSSLGLSNHHFDFLNLSVYLNQFEDKSIDPELSPANNKYYLWTARFNGEVASLVYYETEIDKYSESVSFDDQQQGDWLSTSALYSKLGLTPFDFLDLEFQYDRIGENYQSDGVYFLIRDLQSYTLAYKLRLFRNRFYVQNRYSIVERNLSQKTLKNKTEKLFFDLGTRFKQLPNIQVSYTPINMDIANRLDTSFQDISAFTAVTIARLYYFKKVKKTLYNTALIYSEVENDYFDNKTTQRGFQHFASVSNERSSFAFTSSYQDIFERVQFVSFNGQHQVNEKLGCNFYFAKNFRNDQYSEIIRAGLQFQLAKNYVLGAGAQCLLEKNNAPNWGSTLTLRIIY